VSTLRNFRITIEQPRVIDMKQERDIVVDSFVTFVYGARNHAEVKSVLTTPERLKALRKLGVRITKGQMAQGADVVYAAAGATGLGVLQAALVLLADMMTHDSGCLSEGAALLRALAKSLGE
jgi:hypothetical protein